MAIFINVLFMIVTSNHRSFRYKFNQIHRNHAKESQIRRSTKREKEKNKQTIESAFSTILFKRKEEEKKTRCSKALAGKNE